MPYRVLDSIFKHISFKNRPLNYDYQEEDISMKLFEPYELADGAFEWMNIVRILQQFLERKYEDE